MKTRKTKQPMVWVEEETPLEEALNLITDDWIEGGNYCELTISTLRDACKWAVGRAAAAEAKAVGVRCSDMIGELEAALRIAKELESASRAHGMWGYEDDWNALTTFISQRLDSERGRSPNDQAERP